MSDFQTSAEIARDLSEAPVELLTDIRANVGYVAPHFGVEIEIPTPSGGDST